LGLHAHQGWIDLPHVAALLTDGSAARGAARRSAQGKGEAQIMGVGLGPGFPQGGDVLNGVTIAAGHDLRGAVLLLHSERLGGHG